MNQLTKEERRAMAVWQLREWGVDPTWITYFMKAGCFGDNLADVVNEHIRMYGDLAAENVGSFYKKPRGEPTL